MILLLAAAGAWIALLTLFCCVLVVAGRADRELERSRPPLRAPARRLRLLPGGTQDSSAASSGNRTALASRSSRRPL